MLSFSQSGYVVRHNSIVHHPSVVHSFLVDSKKKHLVCAISKLNNINSETSSCHQSSSAVPYCYLDVPALFIVSFLWSADMHTVNVVAARISGYLRISATV